MNRTTPGRRNESVRAENLASLLKHVHLAGPASRSDIVQSIGLTRSSVGALVGDLVRLGFVREERSEPDGSPGRPSPLVVPEAEHNVVIALEILVGSVAVAVVGLGGDVIEVERQPRERGRRLSEDVDAIVSMVRPMLSSRPNARVLAAGVSVPGLVRHSDSQVVFGANLELADVPLGKLLSEALDLDCPIQVRNDADLGALAESRRGSAIGMSHLVYVVGGVGIGGGVISDGALRSGRSGFGGEVGHISINPAGRRCGCGAVGCWETEVGEEGLLRRLPASFSEDGTLVDQVEAALEAARAGDSEVLAGMAEHGTWLGLGLAGLINTFNPDAIVLGGFLARIHPFTGEAIEQELDRRLSDVLRNGCVVVASQLENATLLGAAEIAWDRVLNDPLAAGEPSPLS